MGVNIKDIQNSIPSFLGIKRRFELLGEYKIDQNSFYWIDDYGHHPTEILAVYNSVKVIWPRRKILVVFQPHRYSRTKDLSKEFKKTFHKIDKLVILDIYAASEKNKDKIDVKKIFKENLSKKNALHIKGFNNLEKNVLNSKFSDKVKLDQSMKKYNTWGVGGLADALYEPESINDLLDFLKLVKDERKFFIGNGSNILVRDKGLRGIVISLKRSLQKCTINDDNSLYVEAGYSCMKIAQYSAKNNLGGLEFLSGVPGTIGGALYMNAGCYGSEIWDFIDYVELINSNCKLVKRRKCDFNINYRNVELKKNELFVGALTFPLKRNHDAENKIKS